MSIVRDRSDQEFLSALQRLQPTTVRELCDSLGVTATAVRQRLMRLQAEGAITRQLLRQDRGRPHHTYSLTDAGTRLLGDDHAEIAGLLWKEIKQIPDPTVRKQILTGIRNSLVERFGRHVDSPMLANRLQGLCSNLIEHGFDVEVEEAEPGLTILREYNCPYHGLVHEDSSFCEIEKSVIEEVIGASVELATCRRDGHKCCEFQISGTNQDHHF